MKYFAMTFQFEYTYILSTTLELLMPCFSTVTSTKETYNNYVLALELMVGWYVFLHGDHVFQLSRHLDICKQLKFWHFYVQNNSLVSFF